jgi:hypothetical protein
MRLAADGTVRDSGLPDVIVPSASQHAVEDLPAEAIVYLLGSRYCETDRLSDVAWKPYAAGDFADWFEAYIGGRWYTFDARNNIPRIGRVLIALGRDAADVPITQTFGPNTLVSFKVWTDELV